MLEIAALLARLSIALTFLVAGIAKFTDLQRTEAALLNFGVPRRLGAPLAVALPLAELVVAVFLAPLPTLLWGSIGALTLLLLFTAAIGFNLALGRRPSCNCFGQVDSVPISPRTLIRSSALTCGAAFVLWDVLSRAPVSAVEWVYGLSGRETIEAGFIALTLLLAVGEAWLIFHLLRQQGRLLLRVDGLELRLGSSSASSLPTAAMAGLPIGSRAPGFELEELYRGSSVTLGTLLARKRMTALVFSDPACGPCTALLPDLVHREQELAESLTIVLISRGSREANLAKIGEHMPKHVLLQKAGEVAADYSVKGTPAAVLVDRDGAIASPTAMGSQAIVDLLAAANSPARLPGSNVSVLTGPLHALRIGDPVPSLKLIDPSGNLVDVALSIGSESLLLFWAPTCGFCTRMLPDLRQWERASRGVPRLIIVSSGTAEANHAMGLRSTILLDQSFELGRALNVKGTPSAVLIDARGRIASGVASGSDAVFALVASGNERLSPVPA